MPTLVIRHPDGSESEHEFSGELKVGRQEGTNDLVLAEGGVSRRHSRFFVEGGKVMVEDVGSANGTFVDGQRTTDVTVLTPRSRVLLGDYELRLKAVKPSRESLRLKGLTGPWANQEFPVRDLPVRRGRSEVPSRHGAGGEASEVVEALAAGGAAASPKRLLVVAASVVGLLLVAGLVKSTLGGGTGAADVPRVRKGPPPPSPAQQMQEMLSQCRSYSSMELGSEPDWAKAEVACSEALDIDPIHSEANTLMRRIRLEKESAEHFSRGLKALQRRKEEEALDLFKRIPKDSAYFRRAKPQVREAVAQVAKRAEDDCKRYLRDNQWSAAVPRCERYMGFACQKMSREELEPPIGFTLVLDKGKRLGRTEWRPKNKLYLDFLIARRRMEPNAAPWRCPVSDIFFEDEAAPDPKKLVEDTFQRRLPNKFMVAAMMDYWAGRGNEAFVTLQKLRSDYELAQYHGDTDTLLTDVSNVDQLFKIGQGHLQNEDVEKAAEPLLEALDVDKRLMGALSDSRPSFYRHHIQQDMASAAIIRGKYWDDRGDQRRACRIWKLGFRFYTGNTDLNAQVGRCSTRGLKALKAAEDCEALDAVLELAVPGDGLEEKVMAVKKEKGC